MKVVSTAKISEKHQVKLHKLFPNFSYNFYKNIDEAIEDVKVADILLTYGGDITSEIIQQSTNLKWIQVLSAGIDQLPFEEIKKNNILITNARGIHYIPMAEYTFQAILQIARKSIEVYNNQLQKKWDREIRMDEIYDKTIGIVGIGSIGQGIANIAKAFNMRVLGMNTDGRAVSNVDQVYKPDNLKEMLAKSDYVVVVVPLIESTFHLIGEEELSSMKNTAHLINIARGEVIDETALIKTLEEKRIGSAFLDVFSQEPLAEDSPLWTLENCFITPHLSGRSPNYMTRALEIFHYNVPFFMEKNYKEMKNYIEIDRGY